MGVEKTDCTCDHEQGGQKLADKWEEKKMFALLRLMGLQEYGLDWTQDYPVSADGLSWPSPGQPFTFVCDKCHLAICQFGLNMLELMGAMTNSLFQELSSTRTDTGLNGKLRRRMSAERIAPLRRWGRSPSTELFSVSSQFLPSRLQGLGQSLCTLWCHTLWQCQV